ALLVGWLAELPPRDCGRDETPRPVAAPGLHRGSRPAVRPGVVLDRADPERRAGDQPAYDLGGGWRRAAAGGDRLRHRPVRRGRAEPLAGGAAGCRGPPRGGALRGGGGRGTPGTGSVGRSATAGGGVRPSGKGPDHAAVAALRLGLGQGGGRVI